MGKETLIETNSGWGNLKAPSVWPLQISIEPVSTAVTASVGAFPLPTGSGDSAMVLTLPPDSSTAAVSSVDGNSGTVLCEICEVWWEYHPSHYNAYIHFLQPCADGGIPFSEYETSEIFLKKSKGRLTCGIALKRPFRCLITAHRC